MDALEVLREMHVEAKSTFMKIEQARPEYWSLIDPTHRVASLYGMANVPRLSSATATTMKFRSFSSA